MCEWVVPIEVWSSCRTEPRELLRGNWVTGSIVREPGAAGMDGECTAGDVARIQLETERLVSIHYAAWSVLAAARAVRDRTTWSGQQLTALKGVLGIAAYTGENLDTTGTLIGNIESANTELTGGLTDTLGNFR